MTVQASTALDANFVRRLSAGEPDWLRALRGAWWRRVEGQPRAPTTEEEWRRTSLKDLPPDGALPPDAPRADYEMDPALAARGVVFTDLATAVREHADLLQAHLGRLDTIPAQTPFWARSLAAWSGGTVLYLPKGVEVDGPL